jgi:hypothetical protein
MTYDLSNPLQKENFLLRVNKLIEKNTIVELKEKKGVRTLSQNSYLHTCISYFAAMTGNTPDYVKREYFKILCSPDIFIREKDDKFRGHIKFLRSTAELDTAEATLAIERFRNWASSEGGIYIASPDEHRMVQLMEIEIERNKDFIQQWENS